MVTSKNNNNNNNKMHFQANKSLNSCAAARGTDASLSGAVRANAPFWCSKLPMCVPDISNLKSLGGIVVFNLLKKILHMKKYRRSACGSVKGPVLSAPRLPLKAAFPLNAYTTATGSPINMFTPYSVIKSEELGPLFEQGTFIRLHHNNTP